MLHIQQNKISPFLDGLTGVMAVLLHDFIMTPFDSTSPSSS